MALQQLDDTQIRTWSRRQKDQWWFDNVYRSNMAQLTLRSALTGFLLGGILAATALYIGAKTGIGIGVGLTSVILSFAIFRILHGMGLASDYTILENNCTQSIATAAGYMINPMISSLAAYMLITGRIIPWWQMLLWVTVVALIGVLVAFPLKRRFVNEDQLPFPEGRACGVVLDSLYTDGAGAGLYKAKLLGYTSLFAGLYQMLVSDGWMRLIQFKILRMDKWAGMTEAWNLQERLDTYYYMAAVKYDWWIPKILGTDIRQLGLRFTVDAAMFGVGGLMGIRVASSVMLGAVINFVFLAPWMIQRGDIAARTLPNGSIVAISRTEIVNQWGLWWAVTMMVVGSLVGLLAKPELFKAAFNSLRGKSEKVKDTGPDPLKDIEVPLWISYVGVPILCGVAAWLINALFGVSYIMALISFPLIFVLTVICINAMALTSWAPIGALAKITQFSMGAIDRSNPATNLIPAGMTSDIAFNASSLLSDIKPGYMLGGKPRHQVIGHIIGIFSGALACVPLFFLLFLPPDHEGLRSTATIVSEQFAFPSALQWKGVAEIIAKGISGLPISAIIAMTIAGLCAVFIEVTNIITKGRLPLSAVSIGLGVVLPPDACLAMWIGALIFWYMGRKYPTEGTQGNTFWVGGCEAISAGLISGAAILGIGNAIINVMMA
ncbi:OPT family oligopeptide transporter [Undibacterium sp. TJN19]|uniref:OPT family oligopeptide transporter n=1 Tax=Undibacterium sp. TJN19 TaxID=3413055 RepID=UPI003BEFBDCF